LSRRAGELACRARERGKRAWNAVRKLKDARERAGNGRESRELKLKAGQ
jgi:hypothetical protein